MDSKTTIEAAVQSCEQCRIGHCLPTKAPYVYWIKKQVLVLPNAPAYCCDICGQLQYDASFLTMLEMLLQELEFGLAPERPAQPAIQSEPSVPWPPARSR